MAHVTRPAAERVLSHLSEEQKKSYWRAYGDSAGQKIIDLFDKFDADTGNPPVTDYIAEMKRGHDEYLRNLTRSA